MSHSEERGQAPKPEVNTDLAIKPYCMCSNCTHWATSTDWCTTNEHVFEQGSRGVSKKRRILHFLKSETDPVKIPPITRFLRTDLTRMERQSDSKIVAHGYAITEPVQQLSETYFDENVHRALDKLGYKYSLPLQSFVWPSIFRQLNIFMIGSPKSGKTMAYLPAVCTFPLSEDSKYAELKKYKGPLVIIVCPNSRQCQEILCLIQKLYQSIHIKPRIAIMTYPLPNINNMDILITIPESLIECLKIRMFNMKRVCHLVLEDASTLLSTNQQHMKQILDLINQTVEHRVVNKNVQIIVSSEKWTNDLKELLFSLHVTPQIYIENHLEAALYSKINIEINFEKRDRKMVNLQQRLQNLYATQKIMIICDHSEILELNKFLVRSGIKTLCASDSTAKDEIEDNENEWLLTQSGQFKVFLCTDFVFETLLILDDVMWLIHYSFPDSWTRFTKRFRAFSAHLQSPLQPAKNAVQCKSSIMIDDQNDVQIRKILHLLSRLKKRFPENLQAFINNFKSGSENKKLQEEIKLCEKMKVFGKCSNWLCNDRHILGDLDRTDLPKSGKAIFKILEIKTVTCYAVQLIEHINSNNTVFPICDVDLNEPLVYLQEPTPAVKLEVGQFYGHCDHSHTGKIYSLCRLVYSGEDNFVEVKLYQTSQILQTFKNKLFLLPDQIKIVDVYMANLRPPFNDEFYSARAFQLARSTLEDSNYRHVQFTGDIQLQFGRYLWLNNVLQLAKVDNVTVVKLNWTRRLQEMNVVELNPYQMTALLKLCEKCKFMVPIQRKIVRMAPRVKEMKAQRAFLDEEPQEVIMSSIISPDEFYVRLAKYQELLENLQKDIQKCLKKVISLKDFKVVKGKYYLVPYLDSEEYFRAVVLDLDDSQALCYFVDYGDECVVALSAIQPLPNKILIKLPFQAIQCSLDGIKPSSGQWDEEATNILYKHVYEPESDIFRSVFVKVTKKESTKEAATDYSYCVKLKDGFNSKETLLNALLVDCGFAVFSGAPVEDFDLPTVKVQEEHSDSDVENSVKFDMDDYPIEGLQEFNEEEMEVEIFDMALFLPQLGLDPIQDEVTSKDIKPEEKTESSSKEPKIIEVRDPEKGPQKFTPEVFWSQTDSLVKLKIKLIGVTHYKVNVVKKRVFLFWTKLDDKDYELKFPLHMSAEIEKHCAYGQEINVCLKKNEPVEWLQLSGGSKRLRNIHYEVTELKEEKKRKFLEIDIPDEKDLDDNVMYHNCSDLGTDYEDELESSD